jgi:hypothetical protein
VLQWTTTASHGLAGMNDLGLVWCLNPLSKGRLFGYGVFTLCSRNCTCGCVQLVNWVCRIDDLGLVEINVDA